MQANSPALRKARSSLSAPRRCFWSTPGFTILTDPNFLHKGEQVHLGYGLRSTRRTNPAIAFEQLPPVDLVILSHMHEDHFDKLVQERLDRSLPIVTTGHASAALNGMGFKSTYPLDTWQSITMSKGTAQLRITSMPGKHGPGLLDKALPQVMGSMLEFSMQGGATTMRLYITGDTLMHEDLKEIPQRYPNIDLAILHLGGTKVMGILLTMDDKQGVEALKLVRPRVALPVHYNDYTVFKSPLRDFARAVRDAGLQNRVRYLKHGDTYNFRVPAPAEIPVRGTMREAQVSAGADQM